MHSASTLGTDIIKRNNSVGVAFSRRRYTQSDNIVLYISAHQPGAVTPAAKRNTYSVAIMVVLAPRVAVFARNPGLGNRNTYSVAVACGLCLSSPVSMWYGRVDYGPLVQLLPLGEGWDGACWLELLPLGRLRWGFLYIMFSPFLLGNIVTRSRIFICINTIF